VGARFFFSSRRRHTRSKRDWSSDVCSSDLAYLGMVLGPMIGIQIADWYVLGRRKTLSVAALYQPGRESAYWYVGGFNPAGILGLILGTVTYAAILDPNTYVPNAAFFQYTTAAVPSVIVGGLVYVICTMIMRRFLPAPPTRQGAAEPTAEGAD